MAIKKTGKTQAQGESKPKACYTAEVTRVHDFSKDDKTVIGFDVKINGVSISGCTYREGVKNGKEWKLVTFPQRKGSDGNYYNIVWIPVSKELTETIAEQIEQML